MIKLLRNSQRRHVRRGEHEVWHSFFAEDLPDPLDSGFGLLLAFDELRIQPVAHLLRLVQFDEPPHQSD
jgi:hypothetical protein